MNSLGSAIQHVRDRLKLRQADLAAQLGCKQNTISQYENGKLIPSPEVLAKIWGLADWVEKQLVIGHFAEMFCLATGDQLQGFARLVLGSSSDPGRVALVDQIDDILNRPINPDLPQRLQPLSEIVSLYRFFGESTPEAHKLFGQAAGWLRVQLQMQRSLLDGAASAKRKRRETGKRARAPETSGADRP